MAVYRRLELYVYCKTNLIILKAGFIYLFIYLSIYLFIFIYYYFIFWKAASSTNILIFLILNASQLHQF